MSGAIPLLPQYDFMAWCLVKAQGQFTFYLYLLSDRVHYVGVLLYETCLRIFRSEEPKSRVKVETLNTYQEGLAGSE
jgi:hypothetical protein